jgi:hypothetical protein
MQTSDNSSLETLARYLDPKDPLYSPEAKNYYAIGKSHYQDEPAKILPV